MHLSKFTDYALRVLMHLAAAQDYSLTTRQIAAIHDAKFHHLAKVTQWLTREGYVTSTRGRTGGLRLARAPEKIAIGTLVRQLEQPSALVECFDADGGACILSPACGLTAALAAAQDAFYASLDQHTLASLAPRDTALTRLLHSLNRPDTAEH